MFCNKCYIWAYTFYWVPGYVSVWSDSFMNYEMSRYKSLSKPNAVGVFYNDLAPEHWQGLMIQHLAWAPRSDFSEPVVWCMIQWLFEVCVCVCV